MQIILTEEEYRALNEKANPIPDNLIQQAVNSYKQATIKQVQYLLMFKHKPELMMQHLIEYLQQH